MCKNTIDNEKLGPFTYMTRMIYHDPTQYKLEPLKGYNCIDVCYDSKKSSYVVKACGEFPYNNDEAIVDSKLL